MLQVVMDFIKIAQLSKLDLSQAEINNLGIASVMNFLKGIDDIDVSGVAPLVNILHDNSEIYNSDSTTNVIPQGDIFANAQNHHDNYFTVPKVID